MGGIKKPEWSGVWGAHRSFAPSIPLPTPISILVAPSAFVMWRLRAVIVEVDKLPGRSTAAVGGRAVVMVV